MNLIDNNLQIFPNPGCVGNFQDVSPNYYLTNQTSYPENLQTENLLQAEGMEQKLSSSSPTGSENNTCENNSTQYNQDVDYVGSSNSPFKYNIPTGHNNFNRNDEGQSSNNNGIASYDYANQNANNQELQIQEYQQPSTSMHYPPTSFIPTQQMETYDWTTCRLTNYNQLQQSNSHLNLTRTHSANLINHYQQLSDSAFGTTTYQQQVDRQSPVEEPEIHVDQSHVEVQENHVDQSPVEEPENHVDQSPVEEKSQQENDDENKRTKVIVPAARYPKVLDNSYIRPPVKKINTFQQLIIKEKCLIEPEQWSEEHVRAWVDWVIVEYDLRNVTSQLFEGFVGESLCELTKDDFIDITKDEKSAKIFIDHLNFLRGVEKTNIITKQEFLPSSSPAISHLQSLVERRFSAFTPVSSKGNSLSCYQGSVARSRMVNGNYNNTAQQTKCSSENLLNNDSEVEAYAKFKHTVRRFSNQGNAQIQLWQFLLELLSDPSNSSSIAWEGMDGEFKIHDPKDVAKRWGEKKKKPNMNYEKLSRALRYYYDKGIMTKVTRKRYTYKFNFNAIFVLPSVGGITSNQHNDDHLYNYPYINPYNYHEFANQSLLASSQDYNTSSMSAGYKPSSFRGYFPRVESDRLGGREQVGVKGGQVGANGGQVGVNGGQVKLMEGSTFYPQLLNTTDIS